MIDVNPITVREHFSKTKEELSLEPLERQIVSYNDSIVDIYIESMKKDFKIDTTYDDITFCQLILIEQIITSDSDYAEKIIDALCVYFRPIDEQLFDNENKDRESALKCKIEALSAGVALTLFDIITENRNKFLFEKFDGVIYKSNKNKTESHKDDTELSRYEDRFYNVFGWYERQRDISKELNMPMNKVLEMRAIDALFELAYQKGKMKLNEYREKNRSK